MTRRWSSLKRLNRIAPREGMNKTESAYADHLQLQLLAGELAWWQFEPVNLRLAKKTWYKPDFMVLKTGTPGEFDELYLIEVKGFWRDDARVKIKVAAEMYPMFKFVAVTRKGNGWEREEF